MTPFTSLMMRLDDARQQFVRAGAPSRRSCRRLSSRRAARRRGRRCARRPCTPTVCDRQEHRERLPDRVVETGAAQLLDPDRVGAAQDREPLRRDLARSRESRGRDRGRAGARPCRPACRACVRRSRTSSLKSSRRGSTSASFIRSGRPPTLWWVLIVCDGPRTDTLSITSGYSVPCTRNAASPSRSASRSKTSMKRWPMMRRFFSGSVTPASASRKRLRASTTVSGMPSPSREDALDLLRLVLAQQAVVDEDAVEPIADRAVHERRGDRGIDAAREAADHVRAADLGRGSCATASSMKASIDHESAAAADAVHEVREQRRRRRRCARPRDGTGCRRAASSVAHGRERASCRSRRRARSRREAAAHGRRGSSRPRATAGPRDRRRAARPGARASDSARPYSRSCDASTTPPSCWHIHWMP